MYNEANSYSVSMTAIHRVSNKRDKCSTWLTAAPRDIAKIKQTISQKAEPWKGAEEQSISKWTLSTIWWSEVVSARSFSQDKNSTTQHERNTCWNTPTPLIAVCCYISHINISFQSVLFCLVFAEVQCKHEYYLLFHCCQRRPEEELFLLSNIIKILWMIPTDHYVWYATSKYSHIFTHFFRPSNFSDQIVLIVHPLFSIRCQCCTTHSLHPPQRLSERSLWKLLGSTWPAAKHWYI